MQDSQEPISPFARVVAAELNERFGLDLSADDIKRLGALATGVFKPAASKEELSSTPSQPAAPAASRQNSVEVAISMALDTGHTFQLERLGTRSRLAVLDPTTPQGVRVLAGFKDTAAVDELLELLGDDLAVGTQVSRVVRLADGTAAFLTVRRYESQGQDGHVQGFELSATPAEAPSLPLDDLGITQVDRWREAVHRENGLCIVHGLGMRTTLRATVSELEVNGLNVCWVDAASISEDLNALGADVYVFPRPIRRRAHLQMVAELAKSATVLATMRAVNASEILAAFNAADVEDEDLAEVLNATLLQVLVPTTPDMFESPGDDDEASVTMLSELVVFEGIDDIDQLRDGDLPMRHLAIDAAEKVRWDEISEETAVQVVGEVLYKYL